MLQSTKGSQQQYCNCVLVITVSCKIFSQERMTAWLVSVKLALAKRGSKMSGEWSAENMMKIFNMGTDLTKPFEYLLATGNLTSKTGTYPHEYE